MWRIIEPTVIVKRDGFHYWQKQRATGHPLVGGFNDGNFTRCVPLHNLYQSQLILLANPTLLKLGNFFGLGCLWKTVGWIFHHMFHYLSTCESLLLFLTKKQQAKLRIIYFQFYKTYVLKSHSILECQSISATDT